MVAIERARTLIIIPGDADVKISTDILGLNPLRFVSRTGALADNVAPSLQRHCGVDSKNGPAVSFATDVEAEVEVKRIFREQWETSKVMTAPEPSDVALEKNEAKVIDDGTVLYADLSGSTTMVQNYKPHFAAEVYRAYLYSAAQIIRNEGGVVTAYDGDRVMAVYLGKAPNTNAATTALKINYAVKSIINPAIAAHYGTTIANTAKQVVGVDRSSL